MKGKDMTATSYFEKEVKDQNEETVMNVEFGKSSFYSGQQVRDGIGEDSIYLNIDGKHITMDRKTAKEFAEAIQSLGRYYGFLEYISIINDADIRN